MNNKVQSISSAREKLAAETDQGDKDSGSSAYLEMCALQMQIAIAEATDEIDAISESIMSAMTEETGTAAEVLTELIVRFQFNDRMKQQLSNVKNNIQRMAKYISEYSPDNEAESWTKLLNETRASFTMESERDLFDKILGSQLLAAESDQSDDENTSASSIELFR